MVESFQPELLRAAYEAYYPPEARLRLDRECRARVVEWRWATDDMVFSLRRPFAREWFRHNPRWLKPRVVPKPGHMRHGLDAEGNIHVVEDWRFLDALDESRLTPTYVVYRGGEYEAVRYRWSSQEPYPVELLRRGVYRGEWLDREHFFRGDGGSEAHYHRDGDRLDRVVTLGWRHRYYDHRRYEWTGITVTSLTEDRFEYDALGRLERIVQRYLDETDGSVRADLPPILRYQRPQKRETLPALRREIERLLVEQVPAVVAARAKGKGPFYCLLLCYCAEDFTAEWPPFLVLGSEAERRRIVAAGEEVACYLWAPDEMRDREPNLELRLEDPALEEACRLHAQLMDTAGSCASGRTALRGAAAALNRLDWSAILAVTPDFVVAPVDNTGEVDPRRDLKAVLPGEEFERLRQRGLL